MKSYIARNHIRLVGKGWELRHRLRVLAKHCQVKGAASATGTASVVRMNCVTLKEYLAAITNE